MEFLDYPENTSNDNIEMCIICSEPLYSSLIIVDNGFYFENSNYENSNINNNDVYTENIFNNRIYQNSTDVIDINNSNIALYNELNELDSYQNNLKSQPVLISPAITSISNTNLSILPSENSSEQSLKSVDLSERIELSSYNTISNNSSVNNSRNNSISSTQDILSHWECKQCHIFIHTECMEKWIIGSITNSKYRCPHCNFEYIKKCRKKPKPQYLYNLTIINYSGNCIRFAISLIVIIIITLIIYYFVSYFIPIFYGIRVNITNIVE